MLGPTAKHRWAYACSKVIDEFLALAYWKETQAAGHHRPPLQHRRAAADRPVRDGDPELRPPGARRAADHRVRRRHAVAQLHLRRRRRRRARGSLDRRAARGRPGLQHRQRPRDHDRRSRREGPGDDRAAVRDRAHPVRPGVRGRLRGHAAARARHLRRSRPSSATSRRVELDEILDARHRATSDSGRPDARITASRSATRRAEAALAQAGEAGPAAAARDRPRPRAAPARDRPDRKHQHLQREVRVLPARRHAPPAGRHGRGALPQDRRRVRRARHHARPDAQLRRAVRRPRSWSRRSATPSRRASRKSG